VQDCFCTAPVLPSSRTGIACQDPCCGVCLPESVFVVFHVCSRKWASDLFEPHHLHLLPCIYLFPFPGYATSLNGECGRHSTVRRCN
jgi:hypothetical protein